MQNSTLCACGCGQPVNPGKRYLKHHYRFPTKQAAEDAETAQLALPIVETPPAEAVAVRWEAPPDHARHLRETRASATHFDYPNPPNPIIPKDQQ
jgi:hypothetical protein